MFSHPQDKDMIVLYGWIIVIKIREDCTREPETIIK